MFALLFQEYTAHEIFEGFEEVLDEATRQTSYEAEVAWFKALDALAEAAALIEVAEKEVSIKAPKYPFPDRSGG